jgi:hypothetical protein
MASEGVLNPRPTSLYHLFCLVTIFLPPTEQKTTMHQKQSNRAYKRPKRTAGFGVLEEVLLLESLFDLRKKRR